MLIQSGPDAGMGTAYPGWSFPVCSSRVARTQFWQFVHLATSMISAHFFMVVRGCAGEELSLLPALDLDQAGVRCDAIGCGRHHSGRSQQVQTATEINCPLPRIDRLVFRAGFVRSDDP